MNSHVELLRTDPSHRTTQTTLDATSISRNPEAAGSSGRQNDGVGLGHDVAAVLRNHHIEPGQLILESTETVLVEDGLALANVGGVKACGPTRRAGCLPAE